MTPAAWLLLLPLVSVGGQTPDRSDPSPAPGFSTASDGPPQTLNSSEPPDRSQTSEPEPTSGAGPRWSSAAPAAPRTDVAASSTAPGGHDGPPAAPGCMLSLRQARILLLVAGVLIVVCVGLLVTACLLCWKLCQRRPGASENQDLISISEFWMGSVERGKARRKKRPAAGENCVLIAQEEKKQEEPGGAGGREAADQTKGKAGAEEVQAGAGPGSDGPTESGPTAEPRLVELPGNQVVESGVTGCEDTHNHD